MLIKYKKVARKFRKVEFPEKISEFSEELSEFWEKPEFFSDLSFWPKSEKKACV